MSDFASRLEKCERAIEQLRGELNVLPSLMHRHLDDIITAVLADVEGANRKMFADLRAQTDAGFARLQMLIDTLPETNKEDEPPKLN
jgi:hypothetical protein